MISLDTETTGIDPWHGSKPFLVTSCNEDNELTYWEWGVDPLTRKPRIPKNDIKEITELVNDEDIVFQNPKFDVRMLETIGVKDWPWERTYDTLMASHLLNSSKQKDLTSSVMIYLDLDISPYEEAVREATNRARRVARRNFPEWRIANRDLPEMPSAKETVWKNDLWLPRAIWKADPKNPELEDWATVTSEYANADSQSTLLLFLEQRKLLEEKGLWNIYLERLKVLPIVYEMEAIGITLSGERLDRLVDEYTRESARSGRVCRNIARTLNYDLELPKSGSNKSLGKFIFEVLKLEPLTRSKKTGAPSLDKATLESYESNLSDTSKAGKFVRHLRGKRKRDTALNYIEGYKKFMINGEQEGWYVLHPSLNPTGTHTLRCSSQNPNEQNISKQEGFNLRYAFGPALGREWWSLDYNNLELRIPAYECEEPAMLELFESPNDPPFYGSYHLLIFSILYPDLFKKHGAKVKDTYKSTLYQYTKNGNFAELYGAVDTGDGKSTADKAFHFPGAQAIVSKRLKKKAALNRKYIQFARKHGYVETLPDKTIDPKRGYPLYFRQKWGSGISVTQPLNYHVQGTACWIMMRAMIKVSEFLPPNYHIVMNVHDELVLDFPFKPKKRNLPKVNMVRKLMESCGDDVGVPLTCGIDYHPVSWDKGE